MWFCCFVVRLRKSARSAGDIGFILCGLIEYSHVNILPQIAQMTQRNAASCIISQRKTDWVGGEFYVVLLFRGSSA